ncbi:MAG: hypothetical protein ABUS79_07400 [Pseudomonadota bacterium]
MNSVRIRLRYPDLDTFIEKFAPNVTRGGVFLASRNIQAVDTVIPFEIQLAGGAVVLAGTGRVTWVKEFNPAEPTRPYGMGVQFVSVEPATKPILARVLRAKEANGLRRPTGQFEPIGAQAGVAAGITNGRSATPPIDTSVDLVAEYGLSDATIRRMIDRSWRIGGRGDDLEDLLRQEPQEVATLAQALAELPRLLDPQYSRRRATGGYRAAEPVIAVRDPALDQPTPPPAAVSPPAVAAADEITQQTVEADLPGDGDTDGESDGLAAAGSDDASDTTDMTGDRDTVETMDTVVSAAPRARESNGRRRRRRR